MEEQPKSAFNVSASLIRRLGEEIVPDPAVALAELVKNAYDADAEWIKIGVSTKEKPDYPNLHHQNQVPGFIKVEDNGKGMSWEEVHKSWMNFSFSAKSKVEETKKNRSQVGGQGMGRLGTMRLGNCVELFTSNGLADEQYHVAFDWSLFDDTRPLTEVPLFAERIPGRREKGTTLIIYPLTDSILEESNWRGIIGQLTNRIFSFIDRKSFRVMLTLNGKEFELGAKVRITEADHNVYFDNVWQKYSPALIQEIVEFWQENKMLRPDISSEERARQVVLLVRSERERKIVGISTAMVLGFKHLNGNTFFYYRSIILPNYRQPGLSTKLIVVTRDYLELFNKEAMCGSCAGLLTFVENPRLQQTRREAIWSASKMVFMGVDQKGRHMRVYYFQGARI